MGDETSLGSSSDEGSLGSTGRNIFATLPESVNRLEDLMFSGHILLPSEPLAEADVLLSLRVMERESLETLVQLMGKALTHHAVAISDVEESSGTLSWGENDLIKYARRRVEVGKEQKRLYEEMITLKGFEDLLGKAQDERDWLANAQDEGVAFPWSSEVVSRLFALQQLLQGSRRRMNRCFEGPEQICKLFDMLPGKVSMGIRMLRKIQIDLERETEEHIQAYEAYRARLPQYSDIAPSTASPWEPTNQKKRGRSPTSCDESFSE